MSLLSRMFRRMAYAANLSYISNGTRVAFILISAILMAGCGKQKSDIPATIPDADESNASAPYPLLQYRPLPSADGPADGPLFTRLTPAETGVNFVNPIDIKHPLKRLYDTGFLCGGVAIGDVDGDGRPDIFLTSGPRRNTLFRQVGDLAFEDVTVRAGIDSGDSWSAGAAMVDIDNDGDLDIYVCNFDSPNALYINRGDGTFSERAKAYGLDMVDASLMPAFSDYDLDGDLDVYVLTNQYTRAGGRPKTLPLGYGPDGKVQVLPEYQKYYGMRPGPPGTEPGLSEVGRPDRLFRNEGNGSFVDVTEAAGIRGLGYGLSATWWDVDSDGRPDIYIGNDMSSPDRLYRNIGDGTFWDVIKQAVPHTTWYSMGADTADLNNDGLFDLLIADMSATTHLKKITSMGNMGFSKWFLETAEPRQYVRNALYLNSGTTRFMEGAYLAGIESSDWTWAVKLADFDNDGRVDVFMSNGMARNAHDSDNPVKPSMLTGRTTWDLHEDKPPLNEQNVAYRNMGDLRFKDVSREWGLDHVGMSCAAAYGDLDRDGDLDLVVANLDEPVSIYRNRSVRTHRILIRLKGTVGNRYGIGATVKVETATGPLQVRRLNPMTGYLSCNDPLIHFGLGTNDTIATMTVTWPGGRQQIFENIPADQFYTITEPAPAPISHPPSRRQPDPRRAEPEHTRHMFRQVAGLQQIRHRERPYDDFARQPLLPHKLSQLGPGMAWADVNGDGYDDLYMSGAAGQTGTLLLMTEKMRLTPHAMDLQKLTADSEEMAPLFFDSDGDGDMDLYVVNGGNEYTNGDPRLRDRLYLNDGNGNFAAAPDGTLPDLRDSGSVVTAADMDRDGDLDLFIGGRMSPGQYPMAPNSRLLRNDNGKFTDVTDALAPTLRKTGMVTAAIWSDADGDGDPDLLVTHEWGPIKFFRNDNGVLVEKTKEAGLAHMLGWWNSIAARDLDGDGDMDYVATNLGLNTKYRATAKRPILLYYGDFAGNGLNRLVEAEYEGATLYPVRGKSCSTDAMVFLAEKFDSFRSFGLASLQDIYTPERLRNAVELKATTLESAVLVNDGSARFTVHPLPRIAQISPGFGIVLTEINGDGYPDLYIVQNFFGPQPETGRMDGGLSQLFLGHANGSDNDGSAYYSGLAPVPAHVSGLMVSGDAKSLTVTDLNRDGWPDFVVGINNEKPLIFLRNPGDSDGHMVSVRLRGRPGNPTAVGARVTVVLTEGPRQTAEVHAGSGYLSQSSADLFFGRGSQGRITAIDVTWPDGSTSTHTPAPDARSVVIDHPK